MRILIVADNALAAEGIRRELRHASGCHIVGFVNGRHPCGDVLAQQEADVVLIDELRTAAHTLERIAELRRAVPDAKLVLLTLCIERAWFDEACAAGIDAAVGKAAQPGSLGTLVREVVRGNVFHAFAPTTPARLSALPSLTNRELETLRLAASGQSNSGIARHLWVTEQTVKFHLSNIYRKLGVTNRTQASHLAHSHGLFEPHPQPDSPPGSAQEAIDAAA